MIRILFVCTGNTCRSSMAEGLFNKLILEDEVLRNKIEVSSAGVAALNGDCASENAIKVLQKEYEVDLNKHRARLLTEDILESSDIILTMSYSHYQYIISSFPRHAKRVFVLKEFINDNNKGCNPFEYSIDICDPFGGDEEVYKKCSMDIKKALEGLIIKIKQNM